MEDTSDLFLSDDDIEDMLWPRSKYDKTNNLPNPSSLSKRKTEVPVLVHDMNKCHICNVDVPNSYTMEHNKSNKHKLFMKIADEALNRVKANMNQEATFNIPKKDTDSYFCDHCVVVIKAEDKIDHDNSSMHAASLKQENDLNNLLILYTDEGIIEEKNALKIAHEKCDTKLKKPHMNVKENNNGLDTDRSIIKLDLNAAKSDLEIYFEYIKKNTNDAHPIHFLKIIGGGCVEFTTETNMYRASIWNFQGLKYELGLIKCMICRTLVPDIETHKWSKQHLDGMAAPISSGCVRQLDDDWCHCILCNVPLSKTSLIVHTVLDADHLKNITKFCTIKPVDKNRDIYCKVCRYSIVGHNFAGHVKGKLHQENAKLQLDTTSDANKNATAEEYHYCEICKVRVVKKNKKKHEKGSTHRDLIQSKILLSESKEYFCDTCSVKVPGKGRKTHENGDRHRKCAVEKAAKIQ